MSRPPIGTEFAQQLIANCCGIIRFYRWKKLDPPEPMTFSLDPTPINYLRGYTTVDRYVCDCGKLDSENGLGITIFDNVGQPYPCVHVVGARCRGHYPGAISTPGRELMPKPILPDFVGEKLDGALRMFRMWKVSSGSTLGALAYSGYIWKPGWNDAGNYTPDTNGGFHGFISLEEMISQESYNCALAMKDPHNFIIGTTLNMGRIAVHSKGARSSYAMPEYMITPSDANYAVQAFEIAEKYRMDLISMDDAAELNTGLVPYVKGMRNEDN